MVVLELTRVRQTHSAQGSRDGALAWCENGTRQEQLCLLENSGRKQWGKGHEQGYNLCWQDEHK